MGGSRDDGETGASGLTLLRKRVAASQEEIYTHSPRGENHVRRIGPKGWGGLPRGGMCEKMDQRQDGSLDKPRIGTSEEQNTAVIATVDGACAGTKVGQEPLAFEGVLLDDELDYID